MISARLIQALWDKYRQSLSDVIRLETILKGQGVDPFILDHFAIIDLPSQHSGIDPLFALFSLLGYEFQGRDYLADKQNDFLWMADTKAKEALSVNALPQIVIADFRLDAMPITIRKIIEKYANAIPPVANDIQQAIKTNKIDLVLSYLLQYFSGRDWPLPTLADFTAVHEANELLAWVLLFGRQPNHFGLSIHLLNRFNDLNQFNQFVTQEVKLTLNQHGSIIKGGPDKGIAQSSTVGNPLTVNLADGTTTIPGRFVEFVWRYPKIQSPKRWGDYYTGFIAQQADQVIESVFTPTR